MHTWLYNLCAKVIYIIIDSVSAYEVDILQHREDIPVRNKLIHCVVCVVQIPEGRCKGLSQKKVPLQSLLCLHCTELLCPQESEQETSI
jgi:hypothetical protein